MKGCIAHQCAVFPSESCIISRWQITGGDATGAEGGAGGDGGAAGNTYGRRLSGYEQPKPAKPTPSTVNVGGNGGNGGNAGNKGKVTGGNGGNGASVHPCNKWNAVLHSVSCCLNVQERFPSFH